MRLLIDTHAFLWFVLNDANLSHTARSLISAPENEIEVSPAVYWEIAIKISIGKYSLSEPYLPFMEKQLAANGFDILPILPRHTAVLTNLPFHHKDPFDRLIVAQAIAEDVPIVSGDETFDGYPIRRLW